MIISRFAGEYRFLSNFFQQRIDLVCTPPMFGLNTCGTARSVEHAYQAAKCCDRENAEWVLRAPTSGDAKRRGRQVIMRSDWEEIRLIVMRDLLALKFSAGGGLLSSKLLATHDAFLVEGNNWGDIFWGQYQGVGQNWLGHLLMARRAEIRAFEPAEVDRCS